MRAEQEEQDKLNDEYGDEDGEEEEVEKKPKEKPELPVFNEEEFLIKWDEENPPVLIPDEIQDEFDRDWVLNEEEEEALVQQYF